MPQEIRVLQCSECETYQDDIVKLAKKWQCKICGTKQTPQTEYFRGTGGECRAKAQALNMARGKQRQEEADIVLELLASNDDLQLAQLELPEHTESEPQPSMSHCNNTKSKWTSYVESVEPATNKPAEEHKAAQFQMFNFECTQRGSNRKATDLKRTNSSDRPTVPQKKCSKWDEFV